MIYVWFCFVSNVSKKLYSIVTSAKIRKGSFVKNLHSLTENSHKISWKHLPGVNFEVLVKLQIQKTRSYGFSLGVLNCVRQMPLSTKHPRAVAALKSYMPYVPYAPSLSYLPCVHYVPFVPSCFDKFSRFLRALMLCLL